MNNSRAMEIANELVDILLTAIDDVEFVLTRLEQSGFSDDEIRSLGFDV